MNDQRTDGQLNAAIGEWHVGKQFTLQKRGLYYRPNGNGYTGNIDEAWQLPLEDAKKHEYNPKGCDEPVLVVALPWRNYTSDLNACHEAEGRLDEDQFDLFRWILWDAVKKPTINAWFRAELSATARQRAEALVKVIEQQKGQG